MSVERPNIVLVVADDLSAGALGCYGGRGELTPRLDRLAREGMRFETCYSTPLCRSSRALLLTGQYGFRTGYLGNDRAYRPEAGTPEADVGRRTTFADLARSRGYATGLVGKWQLSGRLPELIFDCGFDEYLIWGAPEHLPAAALAQWQGFVWTSRYWHPELLENGSSVPTDPADYGPDLYAGWAIDFMRRHRDEPFLLYYPMCLLHEPVEETPDPERPGEFLPASLDSYLRYADGIVGRLEDAVDELGLAGRTIFVFTSDNASQGDGKGDPSEHGARVPFLARWPGVIPAGSVSLELTDHSDVLPTVAELAGARVPAGLILDGTSLVPTLRDPAAPHREWIFSYVETERVVRTRSWLWESATGLYACGASRDGTGYRHVLTADATQSDDPEVEAARARIAAIAAELPAPAGREPERGRLRDRWKEQEE